MLNYYILYLIAERLGQRWREKIEPRWHCLYKHAFEMNDTFSPNTIQNSKSPPLLPL